MMLRKPQNQRKRKGSLSQQKIRKKTKLSPPPNEAALMVGQSFDLLFIIFSFLPVRILLKMMEVSQLWKTVAQDEFLWVRLCKLGWPSEQEFVACLRGIVGSYWKTFQAMYSIKDKCPTTTLLGEGTKKRFTFENLLVFIQVMHCHDIIWAKIETGESLFANQCLEMASPLPKFTCSLGEINHHLRMKLSFILKDNEAKTIWISDRVLSLEDSCIYVTTEGFQVIGSEFSEAEEQFLGVLRLKVDEEETEALSLIMKGVMTFFLSAGLERKGVDDEGKLSERYVLGLLKKTLRWRKGVVY